MPAAAVAQLGALAACVVLFVPMAMAGYHLSRNKMLFFSGALFISLAVLVHLTPFFPSFSHLLLSPLSHSPSPPPSCLPFLHDLSFQRPRFDWPRSAAQSCGFQKLRPSDAADLLNGSWILVAGDSQSRFLVLSLLNLLLDETSMAAARADLFRRHSDYHALIATHGITLDFIWSPYASNVTSTLTEFWTEALDRRPDVLVAGSGLWHMLHVTDPADYGKELSAVRRSAERMLGFGTHMFWLGLPTLVSEKLNTEEKRERMNGSICEGYELEVERSGMLRRSGGLFLLLDVGRLSRECGSECTSDGMHYDAVVYEAAVQVMLNALLIESQQRI